MLDKLNKDEFQIASKLVFDGMSMAKKSMEQILQSPITMEKVDYNSNGENPLPQHLATDSSVHMIKTELMGELKGVSHLLFSEDEVAKIYQTCLPAAIINSTSAESEMMKIGFLTEVDNMMAAAVITELSNFFGLEIYGMVPSLHVEKGSDVNAYLSRELQDFDSIVHFRARFHGAELNIAPDFLWAFQEEFVYKIKDLV